MQHTKDNLVQAHWDNVILLLDVLLDRLKDLSDNVNELRQYYGQDVDS